MTRGDLKLRGQSPKWTVEELERNSVQTRTQQSYGSHIRTHEGMEVPLTYEGMLARVQLQDGTTSGALKGLCSAMQHEIRARRAGGDTSVDPLTKEQVTTISRLLRGRRQLSGTIIPKRGAITWEHVFGLVGWTRGLQDSTNDQRRDLYIAWGTALRTSQVADLRRKHFEKDGAGQWCVTVTELHRPDRLDRDKAQQVTIPVHEKVQDLLDSYLPPLRPEDKVCPTWSARTFNRWIKLASKALGWDHALKWVGVHQLRHGVAVERAKNETRLAAVAQLGHRQAPPARTATDTYIVPNERRAAGAATKRATVSPQIRRSLKRKK